MKITILDTLNQQTITVYNNGVATDLQWGMESLSEHIQLDGLLSLTAGSTLTVRFQVPTNASNVSTRWHTMSAVKIA